MKRGPELLLLLLLGLAALPGCPGCAAKAPSQGEQTGTPSMLRDTPYLVVQVDMSGCAYDVRLNDVSIVSDERGVPVEAELPVNHWARPGENMLEMVLKPLPEGAPEGLLARCSATLMVRKSGTPAEKSQPIADLRFSGALTEPSAGIKESSPTGRFADRPGFPADPQAGTVLVDEVKVTPPEGDRGTVLSRRITLPVLLPRWVWFQSDPIPNNEQTRQQLIAEYQRIWDAVQQKKVPQVLPLFTERNKELAAAFYRTEREMAQKSAQLEQLSVNPGLSLFPLEPEDSVLVVFGGGRLAKLTRWDGNPMIAFNYTDDSGSETFDIVFRKSGNRWLIIR